MSHFLNTILLAASFDLNNANVQIIGASLIIILSYLYNIISEKTNIPSVLMLILTGIGLNFLFDAMGVAELQTLGALKILGTVGLIMIVLEAALDLQLDREKAGLIGKATAVAILGLFAATVGIAGLMTIPTLGMGLSWIEALLYATPLAIMSSAIIIPSVGSLSEHKKEFMIYESTISDIAGIMLFYFLLGFYGPESADLGAASLAFVGRLLITLVVSVIGSYLLIFVFQNLKAHVKLFLLIAILLLIYAVGKMLHLSPLLFPFIFGIILTNQKTFFQGKLRKWAKPKKLKEIENEFYVITIETAFVLRTFFFVIFGLSIDLASLLDPGVLIISAAILLILYAVRFILLRAFVGKDMTPELWIAARGLITVLLFYSLPDELKNNSSNVMGILLFVILGTSLIMTGGLISGGAKPTSLQDMEHDDVGLDLIKPESDIESDDPEQLPENTSHDTDHSTSSEEGDLSPV